MTVADYLESLDPVPEYKLSSSQDEVIMRCPTCPKEKDPKLYVNNYTGLSYCHRCGRSGILDKYKQRSPNGASSDSQPVRPLQVNPRLSLDRVRAHCQALQLPLGRRGLQYLKEERLLTPATIEQCQLGWCPHKKAITIPNVDKAGNVLSLKYRHLDPTESGLRYTQEALGGNSEGSRRKQLPWGLGQLPDVHDGQELYITEGEFDAITLRQLDPNAHVIALPGKNSFPKDKRNDTSGLLAFLRDFERIYLIPDNEVEAKLNFAQFAEVLGRYRCVLISIPHKDLNVCLQRGATTASLRKWKHDALKIEGEPFSTFLEEFDKTLEFFTEYKDSPSYSTGLSQLDDYLAGFRPGELTLLAGTGGSGKSTIALQMAFDCLRQKLPVLIGSYEMHVNQAVIPRMLSLHENKNLLVKGTLDPNALKAPPTFKRLAFLNPGTPSAKTIHIQHALEKVYEEKKLDKHHMVFTVIDHFHRIAKPPAYIRGSDVASFYEEQIMAVKDWTRKFPNIHVLLLTQVNKKGQGVESVTKDFIRGSQAIQAEADNILVLNERQSGVRLNVDKVRHLAGQQGFDVYVDLEYDRDTTRVKEQLLDGSDEF